jgi:hypothetical protein
MKNHLPDVVMYCTPVCAVYHPYQWDSERAYNHKYTPRKWQSRFEQWYKRNGYTKQDIDNMKLNFERVNISCSVQNPE